MKIGEVSKTTGVPGETIRCYEKIGPVSAPASFVMRAATLSGEKLQKRLMVPESGAPSRLFRALPTVQRF